MTARRQWPDVRSPPRLRENAADAVGARELAVTRAFAVRTGRSGPRRVSGPAVRPGAAAGRPWRSSAWRCGPLRARVAATGADAPDGGRPFQVAGRHVPAHLRADPLGGAGEEVDGPRPGPRRAGRGPSAAAPAWRAAAGRAAAARRRGRPRAARWGRGAPRPAGARPRPGSPGAWLSSNAAGLAALAETVEPPLHGPTGRAPVRSARGGTLPYTSREQPAPLRPGGHLKVTCHPRRLLASRAAAPTYRAR